MDSSSAPWNQPIVAVTTPFKAPTSRRGFFLFLLISSLILIIGSFVFFWWLPRVQAEEYVRKTSVQFVILSSKLEVFAGHYIDATEAIENSPGVAPSDYADESDNSTQDIDDIQATLALIKVGQQGRTSLAVPTSVNELDTRLVQYYDQADKAMNLLLEYNLFQKHLLDSSGNELNTTMHKAQSLTPSGGNREEMVATYQKLAQLAAKSKITFDTISSVPSTQQQYYRVQRDYHHDLAAVSKQVADLYAKGTARNDKKALDLMNAFFKRNENYEQKLQSHSEEFVSKSQIGALFTDLKAMGETIKNDYRALQP